MLMNCYILSVDIGCVVYVFLRLFLLILRYEHNLN